MIIYLDMDGVISDFNAVWHEYEPNTPDEQRFWKAVYEDRIFEKLPLMPKAEKLLKFLRKQSAKVEILTATGSSDGRQFNMAASQKLNWLEANRIFFKANFVAHAEQKCDFANGTNTILIDDRRTAIHPFQVFGGIGIEHVDVDDTIEALRKIL